MLTNEELDHYTTIAKSLLIASDAIRGRTADEADIAREDILRKFFMHYTTAFDIFTLNERLIFRLVGDKIIDHGSVNIICRAATEAYLLFYWIFESTLHDPEMTNFRYLIWKITSLYWRQRQTVKYHDVSDKLLKEQKLIDSLIITLKRGTIFSQMKREKQIKCLSKIQEGKDSYTRPSWRTLMEESGFDHHICQIYSYLCEYSHSGAISTIQVREAQDLMTQAKLCSTAMTTNMVLAAKFTHAYCKIYNESHTAIYKSKEHAELIDYYNTIGCTKLEPE